MAESDAAGVIDLAGAAIDSCMTPVALDSATALMALWNCAPEWQRDAAIAAAWAARVHGGDPSVLLRERLGLGPMRVGPHRIRTPQGGR